MSEPQRRLTLTPVHLVRVDAGLEAIEAGNPASEAIEAGNPASEAIEVRARGYGVLLSSLGFFRVWRSLDAVLFRRLPRGRCRALFLGLHGAAWVSLSLPPSARTSVPIVRSPRLPELPSMQALPSLRVQLTVTPPEPPVEEGLP